MTINDNDKWMQKLIGGQVEIVPFYKSTHIVDTVNVLLNVCKTDPSYPPLQDAERTPEAFTNWLIRRTRLKSLGSNSRRRSHRTYCHCKSPFIYNEFLEFN